ncbi:hypothetical protein BDW02DRAFT_601260 [Decorospora gaudefroyi]|uniref:Uncharacterized protein n=1 Tax=Decorospora gaudefroyi TaxID=184978 RepID=A0A6A5K0V0_9PLEO|nr:hypothetical protein BDW02DRAFT_601260 [Decorospora gaudefroyi]
MLKKPSSEVELLLNSEYEEVPDGELSGVESELKFALGDEERFALGTTVMKVVGGTDMKILVTGSLSVGDLPGVELNIEVVGKMLSEEVVKAVVGEVSKVGDVNAVTELVTVVFGLGVGRKEVGLNTMLEILVKGDVTIDDVVGESVNGTEPLRLSNTEEDVGKEGSGDTEETKGSENDSVGETELEGEEKLGFALVGTVKKLEVVVKAGSDVPSEGFGSGKTTVSDVLVTNVVKPPGRVLVNVVRTVEVSGSPDSEVGSGEDPPGKVGDVLAIVVVGSPGITLLRVVGVTSVVGVAGPEGTGGDVPSKTVVEVLLWARRI